MSEKCHGCGGRATHHCEACGPVCDVCVEHCELHGHDWEVTTWD